MVRPTKRALSTERLAELAGVAPSTLKTHERAGAPMPRRGADVDRWLRTYWMWREQRARRPGPAPIPVDPELLQSRRELAKLRVLRGRLEIARDQRQLLPRTEVVDAASEAVLAINQSLDAMVRAVAAQLGTAVAAGAAHVEVVLTKHVEDLRRRFATSGMTRAALAPQNGPAHDADRTSQSTPRAQTPTEDPR